MQGLIPVGALVTSVVNALARHFRKGQRAKHVWTGLVGTARGQWGDGRPRVLSPERPFGQNVCASEQRGPLSPRLACSCHLAPMPPSGLGFLSKAPPARGPLPTASREGAAPSSDQSRKRSPVTPMACREMERGQTLEGIVLRTARQVPMQHPPTHAHQAGAEGTGCRAGCTSTVGSNSTPLLCTWHWFILKTLIQMAFHGMNESFRPCVPWP